VPESLRFLQTKNRIEEMAMVLSKIAESNGNTLPSCVKEVLAANTLSNATNPVLIKIPLKYYNTQLYNHIN